MPERGRRHTGHALERLCERIWLFKAALQGNFADGAGGCS